MKLISASLCLISLQLFVGCETYRLGPPDSGMIPKTDVALSNEQHEIEAVIIPSNMTAAMGGGLLFALADAAVNKSRSDKISDTVAPVRNSLIDYDFNEVLRQSFEKQLLESGVIELDQIRFASLAGGSSTSDIISISTGEAVCLIDPFYSLRDELTLAQVFASVTIYAKSEELKSQITPLKRPSKAANVLYRNDLQAFTLLPIADAGQELNSQSLVQRADELKTIFDELAEELARMLVYDLQIFDTSTETKGDPAYLSSSPLFASGPRVKESQGRIWFRSNDGRLYAVAKNSHIKN